MTMMNFVTLLATLLLVCVAGLAAWAVVQFCQRFEEICLNLYFWPGRIRAAYAYTPRHDTRPAFMRAWNL